MSDHSPQTGKEICAARSRRKPPGQPLYDRHLQPVLQNLPILNLNLTGNLGNE